MNGNFTVNGINAAERFGVRLAKGAYVKLMQWAALKSPDTNDWAEEDGIEVDLTEPMLDTRNLTLNFAGVNQPDEAGMTSYDNFIDYLQINKAYFLFDFYEIGLQFTLRATDNSLSAYNGKFQLFTVTFADDYPEKLIEEFSEYPLMPIEKESGYQIDGKDLCEFGVTILSGTRLSIEKAPNFKKRLTWNYKNFAGAVYDDFGSQTSSFDFVFKCILRAKTIQGLWTNYYGLLKQLSGIAYDSSGVGEEHRLYLVETDEMLPFYYKSQTVNSFGRFGSGLYGIEFSVMLAITKKTSVFICLTDDEDNPLVDEGKDKYVVKNY